MPLLRIPPSDVGMERSFITRRGLLTGSMGQADVAYPPGVTAVSIRNCTGCGACAVACPTNIISIRNGIPEVDFRNGECTFCAKCSDRCPERVFPPEPATRFSNQASIDDGCLALNYVDCQACRDVCPPMAIRFKPRIGGPFVPLLDVDACTGCGACISVCPTQSVSMTPRSMEVANA
jgi:ferredoxin-type protein NapF